MNELKGEGNEKPQNEEVEVIRALIGKTVDIGKGIQENQAGIAGLSNGVSVLREVIGQIPDPTGNLQIILNRLVSIENVLQALNRNFGDVATVYLEDAGRESGRAAAGEALVAELKEHRAFFEKPHRKEVHYTHFLSKPLLVLGGVCLLVGSLGFFLIRSEGRVDRYRDNDMKWRSISLSRDTAVMNVVFQTIEAYRANPEGIRQDVMAEEDRRQELLAKSLSQQKTAQEIRELEQKEKHLPGSR
jgi:hypothetical protein